MPRHDQQLLDEFVPFGLFIFDDFSRLLIETNYWARYDDDTNDKVDKFTYRLADRVMKELEALPPSKRVTAAAGIVLGILLQFSLSGQTEPVI